MVVKIGLPENNLCFASILKVKKEHTLRMFQNRVLKRIFGPKTK